MNIHILFGSETGNAQRIALQTQEHLSKNGHSAEVKGLDEVSVDQLQDMKNILIITSTWGDGEAPSNATKFYEELQNYQGSLNDVSYGVFAIGSSAFPQFCQTGIDFDQFLNDKGAKRIIDLVTADGDYSDEINSWFDQLQKLL